MLYCPSTSTTIAAEITRPSVAVSGTGGRLRHATPADHDRVPSPLDAATLSRSALRSYLCEETARGVGTEALEYTANVRPIA